MVRLIFIALVALAIVIAITSVMALFAIRSATTSKPKEDTMPDTFKTAAYVLLLLLMFGITTGWLAG